MKKHFLFFLLMLLPMVASADAVEIDGIYYNLVSKAKAAEVTKMPSGNYTGDVVIPETVSYEGVDYAVISIGSSAFSYCSGLTSVTIPNSVTSIGGYAFAESTGLTSIIIPNSVTSIGDHAFSCCYDLASITIPNSVTSIEGSAFRGCTGLTSIIIPNSVTSIEGSVFEGCISLTSVTIPNSVTSIEAYAFCGCYVLASITIPNSVTSIGGGAFAGCISLTSVTIPNNVTSIGGDAFESCTGLTSVHISDIDTWCKISFGNIYANPLYYAKHLYLNGTEIKDLVIPNSVTSIGSFVFNGCSNLTSVTIPNSVTSIGMSSFWGCSSLTSVTFGSGITFIGNSAFAKCSELTDVYCYAEKVPSTQTDAFENSYIEYATLYVLESSIEEYKTTDPWKSFKSIVPLEGTIKYKLTYIVDGVTYKEYEHKEGDAITPEANPTKEGYIFSGWSEIPEIMPANDVTVTGTFTIDPDYKEKIRMAVTDGDRTAIGYSSSFGLDFTNVEGVKAWIVSGFTDEAAVLLSRVKIVPPNTGLYLTSDVAGIEVEVPTTEKDVYYANLLKAAVETETIQPTETHDGVEYTNFVVGKLNNGEMGFVRVKATRTLGPKKSRLLVPSSYYPCSSQAPSLNVIFIDGTVTDIKSLEDKSAQDSEHVYDLYGRKLSVNQARKGIYIYKGKKLIIK